MADWLPWGGSVAPGRLRSQPCADLGVSRVRMVFGPRDFTLRSQGSAAAPVLRQMGDDPLRLSRILIEVIVPEDVEPIIEEIDDVTDPDVIIEIEVPQGTDRIIRVEVLNPFEAVIFSGETVVDLFLPVHDVELFLDPIFSVNVALEADISAEEGEELTVEEEDLGLVEFNVDISPEALDRDGVVVIGTRNHPLALPPLPPGIMPMGPVLAFESDGAMLIRPIILTLPYDEFGLASLNLEPEALRFYHLDMGRTAWAEANIIELDPEEVMLMVALPDFGSGVLAVDVR